jgi:hypothetical protein
MGVDHTRPSAIGTPTLGGYSTPKRVWLWFFQPVLKFLNVVWWTSLLMFRGGNINVIYLRQHLFLFCTSFGNKITAGNSVIVCFKTIKRGEKQHKCEYYKKRHFLNGWKLMGIIRLFPTVVVKSYNYSHDYEIKCLYLVTNTLSSADKIKYNARPDTWHIINTVWLYRE